MKRVLWFAMLAACGGGGSGDDFPVEPGGPTGPSTPTDAALIDAVDPDALMTLAGRVCLFADPRTPTTGCSNTGAGGFLVTLGTKTAMTTATGAFTIEKASGSNLVWTVTRNTVIAPSIMPYDTSLILPAMDLDDYFELLGANTVVIPSGQGSIMVRVLRNGAPLADATATVTPVATYAPFYDGPAKFAWTAQKTAANGMVWVPGVDVLQSTTVRVKQGAGAPVAATVTAVDQAITYLTIDLP
jgi:hypothetical protein